MTDSAGDGARPILAFVHIQKTAGTSLLTILRNTFGPAHLEVRTVDQRPGAVFGARDLAVVLRVAPWVRSIAGHEIVAPTTCLPDRVLPYTILREPVARSLSHFEDKQRRGRNPPELEDYLSDSENRNFQVRKIAGKEDFEEARRLLEEAYLFAGVQERFAESVRVLSALSPWPLVLRHRPENVFRRRDLRQALKADPEVMRRFREINELDAALHQWVSRDLYPRLRRRAGEVSDAPLPAFPGDRLPMRYRASRFWQRSVYRYALKLARLRA
ncbi:MAG: hypothetical protein P8080_11320 [Gammaproteobacteria bacterium]